MSSTAIKPGSGLTYLVAGTAIVISTGFTCAVTVSSHTYLITYLFILIGLANFFTARHIGILNRRYTLRITWKDMMGERRRATDYYLFVLGSGGHTKEMLMMMDDGYSNFSNFHRRYIISSGDTMSDHHLEDYEADLRTLCEANGHSPGTYDKCLVTRARRVHQSLLTTPFTALLSLLDVFPVLLARPAGKVGEKLRYPKYIFSNGPATGLFVAAASHLLRMFYVVPEDRMRFVYIESWARISTLSLTGKILYHTGIADIFLVQHKGLTAKYNVGHAGEMVFNSRRPEL
ncbi:glycosyltransferase family protein [Mariannaea sp. PMI_226]|nr:glycosyltransferase family protein [Mariannaea sp. PMI_226]